MRQRAGGCERGRKEESVADVGLSIALWNDIMRNHSALCWIRETLRCSELPPLVTNRLCTCCCNAVRKSIVPTTKCVDCSIAEVREQVEQRNGFFLLIALLSLW